MPNRLAGETSPYLLQHANNPVDWFPWGPDALARAKLLDRPIFLSIGYAACHWCHVMERESFENEEIADMMNKAFINIKVDREELPEIDSLYMEFAQSMMAGAAGWPLNLILTPALEPFFAATYLPAVSRQGLMGLRELIQRIMDIWKSDEREKVLAQASKIVEVFSESGHIRGDELPSRNVIDEAAELLFKLADPVYGGIKGTPKFPIGYQISFLINYSAKSGDSRALFLAERTLEMMHRGGIYDHLGGGFSRYSVDEEWLIPHFEKMLYDNAILAASYTEAWQFTQNDSYKEVAEDILNYVLRDMTHPEGGFYSAEDSETEGKEGLYYTWSEAEIKELLGEDAELFCHYYDITPEGNFEGRNVLNTPVPLQEFATKLEMDAGELKERFAAMRKVLWKARNNRQHPLKDDKIITSWNGLMIHAMVLAGAAFKNARLLQAGVKAAEFIKENLWQDGRLLRRWRDGDAQHAGVLDDYAFMIKACLTLFETQQGTEWLEWAIQLTDILQERFKSEEGAFYSTDGNEENLIIRKCQFSDGAEPSGNAIHCENLLRLYQITSNAGYLSQAEDILRASKKFIDSYALGYMYQIMNLHYFYDRRAASVVIALNTQKEYREELFNLLFRSYIPHKTVIWNHEKDERLYHWAPFIQRQKSIDGQTTLYICHQGVCQQPLWNWPDMIQAIQEL
jgi:uncharacterized protein YyaL (SSP411 family)